MNKCMFSGRIVADPELRTTNNGKKFVRFTLCVDRRFKKGDEWQSDPSFLDFEAWDTGAETLANRAKKGDYLIIDDASIKTDRWETKEGEKRSKLCFRCNHFEFPPVPKDARKAREEEPAMAGAAATAGVDDDATIPF